MVERVKANKFPLIFFIHCLVFPGYYGDRKISEKGGRAYFIKFEVVGLNITHILITREKVLV